MEKTSNMTSQLIQKAVETLEEMRMKWPEPTPDTICIADGYNKAISDIQSLLPQIITGVIEEAVGDLEATLGILEMEGRKTIKISDVRYFLEPLKEVVKE